VTAATFTPKPGAPGARLEFVERRDDTTATRTGVVWSDGPVASTVWVQPDDDPTNQVPVKLPTARRTDRGDKPEVITGYPATWQRDVVRRCDAVRRAGHVFGVADRTDYVGHRDGRPTERAQVVSWHIDPECPSAAGREAYDRAAWTVNEVVAILLGRYQWRVTPRLCSRCVYLDDTAEIGATT
jgi:hypothetical protein